MVKQPPALLLTKLKMLPGFLNFSHLEVVNRKLQLVGDPHIAVRRHIIRLRVASPHEVVDRIYTLKKRGNALQAVSHLARDRIQTDSSALLPVCKLPKL